jgi:hypothetical protein
MDDGLALHKHITQKIGQYSIILTTVDVPIKKFIISVVSQNNAIIIRGEYTILGTYHTVYNYWSWGNANLLIDRTMSKQIKDVRDLILNKISKNKLDEEFKKFVTDNTMILPTTRIYQNITYIDKLMNDHNIVIKNNGDIVTFILINNVFLDNL